MRKDLNLESERVGTKEPIPYRCPDLGFHFTETDERMIKVACRFACKFMQGYGQAPELPLIDLTHFANSAPEEQCKQE